MSVEVFLTGKALESFLKVHDYSLTAIADKVKLVRYSDSGEESNWVSFDAYPKMKERLLKQGELACVYYENGYFVFDDIDLGNYIRRETLAELETVF